MTEHVYHALLQMLVQGVLKRGSVLRIDLLAKTLDVSPTPVREALARLATTGLVQHEARRGYTIAPPLDRKQLAELMDARRLIEVAAIGRACENGCAAFLADLEKALDTQRKAVEAYQSQKDEGGEDLAWQVMVADLRFHHTIFENTGNRFIRVMSQALSAQLHRIRQSAQAGISDDRNALEEHEEILAALRTGDRAVAERAMEKHINNVERRSELDLTD
ncbi:GntR family transcriptional regulator [Martelella soudanensis]|uniref:GntR family transcriptional regulator n=1 Tax=unclassified Martelella TaxID=2629616 RepID=UPI0015DFACEC|nr:MULTISPECIES: GntR family transcriptional regulator [unclassified Martelella]